jgi:putative MATE family efflux protein
MLARTPVKRLLWKLSAPAMVGMMTMALYNVVDTIYVGHGVGPLGIAGVTISFPIMMLLMAVGQMFGLGAASVVSRNLGAGQMRRAETALGNAAMAVIALGVLVTIVCLPISTSILRLFGASETILPYAKDYLDVVLLGAAFSAYPMTVNSLVRAEGNARVAMNSMLLGAGLNIALDPVFIFGLGMGVRGAAIATVLSHVVTTVYVTWYFRSGRSTLRLSMPAMRPHWSILRETVSIGFPSFVRMGAMSLIALIINRTLGFYGGDLSIAAYGIVNRTMMFAAMPLMGIGQGLQPILGFSYGARRFDRAYDVARFALLVAVAYAVFAFVLLVFFAGLVARIFSTDAALVEIAVHAARYVYAAFFVVGFQIVGSVVFQSIGLARQTLITSVSRQVLFLVPLLIVLPRFFEADGVWLSFPIADVLATILTVVLLVPLLMDFRRKRDMQALNIASAHEENNDIVPVPASTE